MGLFVLSSGLKRKDTKERKIGISERRINGHRIGMFNMVQGYILEVFLSNRLMELQLQVQNPIKPFLRRPFNEKNPPM